jgi:glutamate dehydrogenase
MDLLWLGGIGTYVKASSESHEQVGDRANDAARIDAAQLRAKIVGEGANLGFTQKARIEFALNGGLINLDAVDNSAGVDLSDHEVNLKILMAGEARRDEWLSGLTEEVCAAVLTDNRAQSLCISLDRERCLADAKLFLDVAERLENADVLNRAAESFPTRKDVSARPGASLTRPELAVLMLHSKLALKQALLERPDFLAQPTLQQWLAAYFPAALSASHAGAFQRHPLARDITATCLTNAVINQAGCGFLAWTEEFDADALVAAVQAYLHYDRLFGGPTLREAIDALQHRLSAAREYELLLRLETVLAECSSWRLRQGQALQTAEEGGRLDDYLGYLQEQLTPAAKAFLLAERTALEHEGFAPDAALKLALLDHLGDFPGLAALARAAQVPLPQAAQCQHALADCLGLGQIDATLKQLPVRDDLERRVQQRLRETFQRQTARLAGALLTAAPLSPEAFIQQRGGRTNLERLRRLQREIDAAPTILPYVALAAEFDALIESCLQSV